MFHCQSCGVNVGPRVQVRRVTAERRERVYPERHGKINKYWSEEDEKWAWRGDAGGVGWEIAKELKVCERCEKKFFTAQVEA